MPHHESTPYPADHSDVVNPPIEERIAALMAADDETYNAGVDALLDERLQELCETPQKGSISILNGSHQGFVGPTTDIQPQLGQMSYRLDDREPYRLAMDHMRAHYGKLIEKVGPAKAYFNAALRAAQYSEIEYFGNVQSPLQTSAKRDYLLSDLVSEDEVPEHRSIAEFKGIAMCMERAVIANNVLQIFGVKPVLELGELSIGGDRSELHAYLFVAVSDGSVRLFDPQNPTPSFSQDGSLKAIALSMYPADEFLAARREGDASLEVTHISKGVGAQGEAYVKETPYVYKLGWKDTGVHPS